MSRQNLPIMHFLHALFVRIYKLHGVDLYKNLSIDTIVRTILFKNKK